jgi:superfamily II DNA/RNA helicase
MENTFDKNSTFDMLGITPPILKALGDMGFEMPTEVQSKAIPHILNKKDMIVMSKTGSGKTAVYGVSMLQLTDPGAEGPQGLPDTHQGARCTGGQRYPPDGKASVSQNDGSIWPT